MTQPHALDSLDRKILDGLQGGFPITERPFAQAGQAFGISEDALIHRLSRLLADGLLSRFGPLFNTEAMGGAVTLAAMAVPAERFAAVAEQVNAYPEVAHNYARDHALNMWFVVLAESRARLTAVLDAIAAETGLTVYDFPKEREFFLGFKVSLAEAGEGVGAGAHEAPAKAQGAEMGGGEPISLDALDRRLIAETQGGLPLTPRPYHAVAQSLGCAPEEVMARFRRLLAGGVIRRMGIIPHHYALGITANGMTVWDVADAALPALGEKVGALDFVSHCYLRPRHRPIWPYNLFAMVHGRSREEVVAKAQIIGELLGEACRASDILFSHRVLKKTGLRLPHMENAGG